MSTRRAMPQLTTAGLQPSATGWTSLYHEPGEARPAPATATHMPDNTLPASTAQIILVAKHRTAGPAASHKTCSPAAALSNILLTCLISAYVQKPAVYIPAAHYAEHWPLQQDPQSAPTASWVHCWRCFPHSCSCFTFRYPSHRVLSCFHTGLTSCKHRQFGHGSANVCSGQQHTTGPGGIGSACEVAVPACLC